MARIGYLDIIGGVSGDMLISAMLDAGLPLGKLNSELCKIVSDDFRIRDRKTSRGAIAATHIDVISSEADSQRMDWDAFYSCIDRSQLPSSDNEKIRSIFKCLQNAEVQAHGTHSAAEHLHELGTIDTLVDIAGAVVGLRLLNVHSLHSSPLPASTGISSSSHGTGASFAPATMAIIQNTGLPIRISGAYQPAGECVTPTGAAIVATLSSFSPVNMQIEMIGYGAGTRESERPPNVVGLWIGDLVHDAPALEQTAESIGVELQSDTVQIETNLDDVTGEELGFAMERIFDAGALDAWVTPIQMKKSRPAFVLSAICNLSDLNRVAKAVFKYTTTLGLRVRSLKRFVAAREMVVISTEYGDVTVKLRRQGGDVTHVSPEYDDCASIASRLGVPIRHVVDAALRAAADYASK